MTKLTKWLHRAAKALTPVAELLLKVLGVIRLIWWLLGELFKVLRGGIL